MGFHTRAGRGPGVPFGVVYDEFRDFRYFYDFGGAIADFSMHQTNHKQQYGRVDLQRFCKTPNFSNTLSSKCEETFSKRESTSSQLFNAVLDSMIGSLLVPVENEPVKVCMLYCFLERLLLQSSLSS